ncbi:MAG: hypothetical protein LH702_25325 [Phormidesmis sp. CAN_BIN44]|nr:hypothetical protein [Phormidesmis sp. CAN_BIN44]
MNAIARSVMAKSARRSTETSLQHRVNPSSSITVKRWVTTLPDSLYNFSSPNLLL